MITKKAHAAPKPTPTQTEIDDKISDILINCWNELVPYFESDIEIIQRIHSFNRSSIETSLEYHKDCEREEKDVAKLYEMLGKLEYIGDL